MLLAGMSLITLTLLTLLSVLAVSGIGVSVGGGTGCMHVFGDLSTVSSYFSRLKDEENHKMQGKIED